MDGVVKHGWMVASLKDNGEKIQEVMDKCQWLIKIPTLESLKTTNLMGMGN